MKKKLLYICSLLLLGHTALYILFISLSRNRSELVCKFNEYMQLKDPADVLILGDSHAERGLDLSKLPNCNSLAYYGENNVMNYYRLKACIENGKKIKYVILPCDLVTFSKGFHNFRSHKFFYYPLIPYSELSQTETNTLNAWYQSLKARLVPYAEWQYGMNIWSRERERKGAGRFSVLSIEERKANARNFIQNEMACHNKRDNLFYTTSLTYLKKTIDLCRSYDLKPIFVRYPLTNEVFEEVRNNIGNNCITDRPAERIIRENKIPILDMESIFRDNPELFFDCHHLNRKGQKELTPLFKMKIDSLLRIY